MTANAPPIQNSIRLSGFTVPEISMETPELIDPSITDSLALDLEVDFDFSQEESCVYAIIFHAELKSVSGDFRLFIKGIGWFHTSNEITDEFKESNFVRVNSPAIAFPFVRSFINTLTSNAGLNPVILPAYNFSQDAKK